MLIFQFTESNLKVYLKPVANFEVKKPYSSLHEQDLINSRHF